MEKQKTYRWLIWVVVILLATNLSMAVSFYYHKKQESQEEAAWEETTPEVPLERRTSFFREQLGLNPGQMDSFRELNREYNRKSHVVARELEALRYDMIRELGKENANQDSLYRITSEIGKRHIELKNITIDYYQKISEICSPQQCRRLNEVFMSMLNPAGKEQLPYRGRRNRFRN
jgi:hypothetical protein